MTVTDAATERDALVERLVRGAAVTFDGFVTYPGERLGL